MKQYFNICTLILIFNFCTIRSDAQTVNELIDKISNRFCDSLSTYQSQDINKMSFAEHFMDVRGRFFDLDKPDINELFQLTFDTQTRVVDRKPWKAILEKTIKECKVYRLMLFPKNDVNGELRPLLKQISDSACVCFTLKTENMPIESLFEHENNEKSMVILYKCILESASSFAASMLKEYENEKNNTSAKESRIVSAYLFSQCDRAVQSQAEVFTPWVIMKLNKQAKKKREKQD